MISPIKVTEYVKKVNSDTPAVNGTQDIVQGNTLRFHIPYVGGNAILNPKSIVIRGEFCPSAGDGVTFSREGIHGIFKAMRVKHGDRTIEEIERYADYASWYTQLHYSGVHGTQIHAPADFSDLGNCVTPPTTAGTGVPFPNAGNYAITQLDGGLTGHEFTFTPLSAVLGSRATKEKFPLCVLNPMEPLVLEFDLDLDGTLINWSTSVGSFTLRNCYLNADYDMVGESLGSQLRSSMSGITWDIPGLEKHEHTKEMPGNDTAQQGLAGTSYGGTTAPDVEDHYFIRSNVQAMTRMIHYFKHQGWEQNLATNFANERSFLQYPELTRWQYLIGNQFVPDRTMTATIYQTAAANSAWPRAHFGRIYTTSMKTAGKIGLTPSCGFNPMFDFVFDYSKKLPGSTGGTRIYSMTKPFEMGTLEGERGDEGAFFLAYDFTRQVEGGASKRSPWGEGSFRLKDTEFEVHLGMNNRLGNGTATAPVAYTLVVVTLVEYKRKLVLDKLGRLEAFF